VSLEHKLGIHASPTCVMSFGDNDGAIGYLVGEEQGGMRAMFTMMNNARLGVGLLGLAIAERAYQAAHVYAEERVQGGRAENGSAQPVTIIEYQDVKRMLLSMQCRIEAMRSMVYVTAAALDRATKLEEGAEHQAAKERVDLLIPLVKAWCSDNGFEIASEAVQVHGGMGYIEETGAAQHMRDARINMIYEGTNGIQALDLVGRKLFLADGAAVASLFDELDADLADLQDGKVKTVLTLALDTLRDATSWLQHGDRTPEARQAGATPYLRLFATTLGGFLLARASELAEKAGDDDAKSRADSARFYVQQILPPALGLLPAIKMGQLPEPRRAG
jgi:acyl-CoA dehydrogenase